MKLVSAKPRSPNPYYALRQFLNANHNYTKTFHTGWVLHPMALEWERERRRINNIPGPHNKNTAQKLKFARLRNNKYGRVHRPRIPWLKASRAQTKTRNKIGPYYGQSGQRMMAGWQAARILKLAEMRAARTVAKALRSSPVMRRVEGKRRARNFIREELALYRRPNSTVRPSNVKARRINSVM
jgi:hypothetical protein